jgi:hypothetical protein
MSFSFLHLRQILIDIYYIISYVENMGFLFFVYRKYGFVFFLFFVYRKYSVFMFFYRKRGEGVWIVLLLR